MFQSAPLTGARGDISIDNAVAAGAQFQSAPLTGARGDSACPREGINRVQVSIRSPDRSQGRLGQQAIAESRADGFNPLP